MQVIGMLDSPYVRRVVISLQLMGLPFQHRSVSVFRGFEEFRRINPVVKAPSLVCDDGEVLMDSTLILEYAEGLPGRRRSLVPAEAAERQRCLRLTGLALAACEKAVQIVYEHHVRPADKLHAPWLERVTAQMHTAFAALEAEAQRRPFAAGSATMDQAGLSTAVTWFFMRDLYPELLDPAVYPALNAFSAAAEHLPEFRAAPHGDGTYIPA